MMILAQPTEKQFHLIYGEFDSTPEAVRRDVLSLMEWLEKQPHLPNVKDEDILTHCLLRCKNSMEQAKLVLDRYYTLKAVMPDVYENRDPCDTGIVTCMKCISFIPVPELTDEGCRVSILRILDATKYEQVNPDDVIKSIFMSADIRLKIDACHSDIFIFDFQNFILPVITLMMANMRKFILPGTKGLPMRQKNYYIVNASPSAESLIMFAKSFLRKDLLKKLIVLRSTEELLNVIPQKCLPKDYGGDLATFEELNDSWIKTLQHYKGWFEEQEAMKADNSKRFFREDSQLGDLPLDGSFRKITID